MITRFKDNYRFLSNFYTCWITINGIKYRSVEHYYQSEKTSDIEQKELIISCYSAREAKNLGQEVDLRGDWNKVKLRIMARGLVAKFSKPEFNKRLVNTYPKKLVKGNTWHDNYWGDCRCFKCKYVEGKNHLGYLLMLLRDRFVTKKD